MHAFIKITFMMLDSGSPLLLYTVCPPPPFRRGAISHDLPIDQLDTIAIIIDCSAIVAYVTTTPRALWMHLPAAVTSSKIRHCTTSAKTCDIKSCPFPHHGSAVVLFQVLLMISLLSPELPDGARRSTARGTVVTWVLLPNPTILLNLKCRSFHNFRQDSHENAPCVLWLPCGVLVRRRRFAQENA